MRSAKVLYIMCDSRSGSSILQGMLSKYEDVVALGEVRRFRHIVSENAVCGCGTPISDCEFWQNIASKTGLELSGIKTVTVLKPWIRIVVHMMAISALFFNSSILKIVALYPIKKEVKNCQKIIDAAVDLTGARIIIDSSKVPSHFIYMRLNSDNVEPVFLIRDGRAVVWSKVKRTGISVKEATIQWRRNIKWMLLIRKLIDSPSTFITYESFCEQPDATIDQILNRIELSTNLAQCSAKPESSHTLGGSPSFDTQNAINIRYDDSWKKSMPVNALEEFEKIGGNLNRSLGYD